MWIGLFGFFLTILGADIDSWVSSNQNWLIPAAGLMCLVATLNLGWMIGRYNSLENKISSENIANLTLTKMWQREQEANVVWVVSPELYYDVVNIECQQAVMSNLRRNVKYKYIIEKNKDTDQRLIEYQRIFKLSKKEMKKQFLTLPASDLTRFQTEIVIYDPASSDSAAFGYPHSSAVADPDVIVFSRKVVQHYIERFNGVWIDNKDNSHHAY